MFMTNNILTRWTLDSVPLPLIMKAETCKGNSAILVRAQVQIYVNQTELISDLNFQCNYFTFVKRHFRSKNK